MNNSLIKLLFLFVLATFSFIWISDQLAVIIEDEQYSFYELTEKSDGENKVENELKTQFINKIEALNCTIILFLKKKNNTAYLFNSNEFFSENLTPPPQV
ncbi:hypothetical protein [Flavobacterium sp. XS2P39]|uniref:hypothetical protein n=1 Tax=Flavobacterium sp. XS2P39 TaxID=3401725 RepID=UPI003AAB4026